MGGAAERTAVLQVDEQKSTICALSSKQQALDEDLQHARCEGEAAAAALVKQGRLQSELRDKLHMEQRARSLAESSFLAAQARCKAAAGQV